MIIRTYIQTHSCIHMQLKTYFNEIQNKISLIKT